jgi:hypothetical protein
MGVHDEDTKHYFKNIVVRYVFAPHYGEASSAGSSNK